MCTWCFEESGGWEYVGRADGAPARVDDDDEHEMVQMLQRPMVGGSRGGGRFSLLEANDDDEADDGESGSSDALVDQVADAVDEIVYGNVVGRAAHAASVPSAARYDDERAAEAVGVRDDGAASDVLAGGKKLRCELMNADHLMLAGTAGAAKMLGL